MAYLVNLTGRQRVLFLNSDRELYLHLPHRILAVVVVPERPNSLALPFRRVHGRYAQYIDTRRRRTGHLWQGRFYSCPLSFSHLATALRYVEQNPCCRLHRRAPRGLSLVQRRCTPKGVPDRYAILDNEFFERFGVATTWREMFAESITEATIEDLRGCTYAGRPFGDDAFVAELEEHFGRVWRHAAPENRAKTAKT